MTFTLTINMDNAAFEGNPGHELKRILERLARRSWDIDGRVDGAKLMDVNGNSVGSWEVR